MIRGLRLALAVCSMLFAAACLPVSTTAPVGSTVGLGVDPALIGTWKVIPQKAEAAGSPGYVHFLHGENNSFSALLVATGTAEKGEGEWSAYALTAAELGDHHYLNARPLSQNGKPAEGREARLNVPVLYRIQRDGSIAFYLIGEEAAKAAIAAGEIAGTVSKDKLGDVTLTAPPAALDKFFATDAGASLFTERLMVLRRLD